MNDTYKRGRDVLLASYAIRYPELVKNPPAAASQRVTAAHVAQVNEGDVDAAVSSLAKRSIRLDGANVPLISGPGERKEATDGTGKALLGMHQL